MRKFIDTDKAPRAIGPYSQAVVLNGMVYTSGQIALDPETQEFLQGDVAEQTERVLKNLKAVLEEAGSSLEEAVKVTVFIKNMDDFPVVNEVYARYFVNKPARSTVEVSRLPKDALVEIECIALVS